MKRHFIVVAVGSAGDVHPLAAVARALKSRGHRVTFMASGFFANLADQMRLDFVELSSKAEYEAAMQDPDLWHPSRGFKAIWKRIGIHTQANLDWIRAHSEANTVLVGSTLAFSARIARDCLNIPMATVHLAPMALMSAMDPPQMRKYALPKWLPLSWVKMIWSVSERFLIDPVIAPDINAARFSVKLPPVKHIMCRYVHSPDKVLLFYPEWFASNPGDWPVNSQCVGFPRFDEAGLHELPSALNAFLAAGDKPLLFTPGSAMRHAQRFFEHAVASCKTLGRRGIIVTPYPEQLPPLPDNILQLDYVPFSQILPHVALVAHHGGIGTCSQGLAAGIPQLVIPNAHDQFDNGNRLKRLGVGDWLPLDSSAEQFAAAIQNLLSNSATANACAHWRQNLASPTQVLDEICNTLENLTITKG